MSAQRGEASVGVPAPPRRLYFAGPAEGRRCGAQRGGASTSVGTGRRAQLFAAGERGHGAAPAMLRGDPGLCAGKRDGFVQRPAPRP